MIGHIIKASVRPCLGHDIGIEMRASMRASVRPVWDTASASIYESQCKTYLGHGIDFDVLASHLTLCLRLSEYPVVFQMVQRETYGLSRNNRDYGYVVSGIACQVSSGLEIVGGNIILSSHYRWNNEAYIRNFK
ncbi:Uncharacterized protein F383_11480 [Gossypium arboreum]|uniref:Uncharacterized protein n=1 Tax=Gossypium arboreum TaxID=29729 RepID=A0A0B0PQ85_GOSAR|nr:Uncharacterized protein F383_11480 [Gossypium arboreum]